MQNGDVMQTTLKIPHPNDRQREFFMAREKYIAYGGARGGGKSWAVRVKSILMSLKYPNIKILILRRTYPELRENHIIPMQQMLHGIAAYRDADKSFTFGNGSRIKFGYCDTERDMLQYQGQEYDVLFIDEATQFYEDWYIKLKACVRGTNGIPKRIYLTCNPGGVGHTWVKRLFIDRRFTADERPDEYKMIRASVYDNRALMESDPGYISMLQTLPDNLRRAWLDGDWDIFAGQYFSEFNRDIHVMQPVTLPAYWYRYFTLDYGMDMLAGYWIAVDEQGRAYVYKEVYKSKLIVSDAAEIIKSMTTEPIRAYYAPPDLWNRQSQTGESTAEIFAQHGLYLTMASNDRVQGWYALKEWMKPCMDEQGKTIANLRIFDNCENLIRTLPALQFDEKNPNDCAREPHDLTHAPDAIRYFVAGRPLPAAVEPEPDETSMESQYQSLLNYGR